MIGDNFVVAYNVNTVIDTTEDPSAWLFDRRKPLKHLGFGYKIYQNSRSPFTVYQRATLFATELQKSCILSQEFARTTIKPSCFTVVLPCFI